MCVWGVLLHIWCLSGWRFQRQLDQIKVSSWEKVYLMEVPTLTTNVFLEFPLRLLVQVFLKLVRYLWLPNFGSVLVTEKRWAVLQLWAVCTTLASIFQSCLLPPSQVSACCQRSGETWANLTLCTTWLLYPDSWGRVMVLVLKFGRIAASGCSYTSAPHSPGNSAVEEQMPGDSESANLAVCLPWILWMTCTRLTTCDQNLHWEMFWLVLEWR